MIKSRLLLTLLMAAVVIGCSPKDPTNPNFVVASGKGIKILRKDLTAERELQMKMNPMPMQLPPAQLAYVDQSVLENMITRQILLNAAGPVTPAVKEQVKKNVEAIKARYGSEEVLKTELGKAGFDLPRLEKEFVNQSLIQSYVAQSVEKNQASLAVTDEQAKAFFDENAAAFSAPVPELSQARHILVRIPPDADAKTKAEKRKILDDARKNIVSKKQKFEDVAREVSEDTSTGPQGGVLPAISKEQAEAAPEFEKALFGLPIGQVSAIVTSPAGLHLIEVLKRTPSHKQTFEEVKDRIKEQLGAERRNQFLVKHIADLKAKAEVKIFLPTPPPMPSMGMPGAGSLQPAPEPENVPAPQPPAAPAKK